LAATFVSLGCFLYCASNATECFGIQLSAMECIGSSTYSIIVICTRYKHYVLEEDNNAIVLNYVVYQIIDAITYVC
jgi:hypothetical protein